jgi:hypothetical protein
MFTEDIVCFIISTEFTPLQNLQKDLWREYMNAHPRIRSFFIESRDDIDQNILISEDTSTIYFKGEESIIPGIFEKRMKAFDFALKNFKALKYVIQTNLSSFWIWDRLVKLLPENPYPDFVMGHKWSGFPSGSGTVYSREVAQKIIDTPINRPIEPDMEHDDCVMGKILAYNNIHFYNGYYHMNHDIDTIPSNCYHLRARINIHLNEKERIETEMPFLEKCLKHFYPEL